MHRMLGALLTAALVLVPLGAHAQKTKAQLNTEVSTNFPDNTTGAITPSILRTTTNDIIASMQQYAGINPQNGASYTINLTDYGQLVVFNNAGAVAVTLPQATGSFSTFNFFVLNRGAGTVTITPTTSTINTAATLALTTNQSAFIVSDGTNYFATVAAPGGSGGGTVTNLTPGRNIVSANGSPISSSGSIYQEQGTPGGRLTVVSGGCNVNTDQVAQTSIFYSPCGGKYVPIYDGTVMSMQAFTASDTDTAGLSISLASSANWTANTLYDVFVGLNSSTVTLCTGPAWTNSGAGTSARGTGAGTTELQLFKGVQTNKNSMTCRFGAASTFTCSVNQCTWLGTFLAGASNGTIDLKFGTFAASGGLALISICNAYNPKIFRTAGGDTTASWTYTSTTWRAANAGNTKASVVSCVGDTEYSVKYSDLILPATTSSFQNISIGLNASNAIATRATTSTGSGVGGATPPAGVYLVSTLEETPVLGLNTFFAIENADGTHATTFNGQATPFNYMLLSARGEW